MSPRLRLMRALWLVTKEESVMVSLIEEHRLQIDDLCRKFDVKRLEVFGSALSEEKFDVRSSDLDFLIEFCPMEPVQHAKSYFGLLEALQNLFSRQIDLVEVKAISNPYLLDSINRKRQEVYAA